MDCSTAVDNRILVSRTMEPSFRIDNCLEERFYLSRAKVSLSTDWSA